MKIQSVTLKGFRCFGDATTVDLSEHITTLVGVNGSGKTAFLDALLRVFGITREQRDVQRTDFYVPPGTLPDDRSPREFYIDVRLTFPELVQQQKGQKASTHAVPPCFNHMVVVKQGGTPFCRVRLEAKWTDDGTIDGCIKQDLFWILSDDQIPKDEQKRPMDPCERGLIQVHYVPATRDSSKQLGYATGAMARRLFRAIAWSMKVQQTVKDSSQNVCGAFEEEIAIQVINEAIARRWSDLHDETINAEPELQILSRRFEEIVRHFNVVFHPSETGGEQELDALSEGQKSLFYFALVAAVFDVERKILETSSADGSVLGFNRELLQAPSLTIFALEEPENHLAPHFLARIIRQVRSIVESQTAQAIFTSHSPAILGRAEPTEIRHFRLQSNSHTSIVRGIKLPDLPEDAAKYVHEAVIAFPEIYFARFVILGEGASEQIVIPRLASALENLDTDCAFISIVPLGGRHVNHFWKLLSDLNIPYATLIDLDLGRAGGAWGRIKYACEQLRFIGIDINQLLMVEDEHGVEHALSEEEFEQLHTWDAHDSKTLESWAQALENFGIFFSWPLDLDMEMLSHFPAIYQTTIPADYGPRIPATGTPHYANYFEAAAKAVLGEEGEPAMYSGGLEQLQLLFPWYRYLFLGKSKPSTHLLALSQIDNHALTSHTPPVLRRLLDYVNSRLCSIKGQTL